MKIECEKFGVTKNQEDVLNYIITTQNMKLEVLNYGCIIKSLYTQNKNGTLKNVVLGFEDLKNYEENNTPYFGCVVGRTAGRIKNGLLKIGNEEYQLPKNDGNNTLHGGINGLNKKVWESHAILLKNKIILNFKLSSPHMEEGFPGAVEFTVKYIIRNNSITIEYLGVPDRDTYMSLTNHTYFNLSGNFEENILQQEIKLNAEGYYSINKETLPLKLITEDEIFSPNKSIYLKDSLEKNSEQISLGGGYDHPFLLSKKYDIDGYAVDKNSGIKLTVKTDQPVIVLYTGNYLASQTNYKKHGGFCLEAQDYPDIANLYPTKMKIYSPKNPYFQKTIYTFELE